MTRRVIDGGDLTASLAAAQEALVQSPSGSRDTWILPPGLFSISQSIRLGSSERSLIIEGVDTELIFELNGTINTALEVLGDHVGVTGIRLRAERPGDLVGLNLEATERAIVNRLNLLDLRGDSVTAIIIRAQKVEVEDIALASIRAGAGAAVGIHAEATESANFRKLDLLDLHGAQATGIHVDAPMASTNLFDISVSDLRATAGTAIGLFINGSKTIVSRPHIARIAGSDVARGLDITSNTALTVSMARVQNVRATSTEGLRLYVSGKTGELSVLDARAEDIKTPSDGSDAIGINLLSGGDIDVRGLSVVNVHGARGTGVLLAAAGEVDLLAGDIRDIRGITVGAAGIRVLAGSSQKHIAVRDVEVEAVRADTNGAQARPPSSWTAWIDNAVTPLRDRGNLPPLPSTALPEHEEDVVGLHIGARVTEFEAWIDSADPGPIYVEQCVLRRISGTALQVEGELRDVEIRGAEGWTAVRGGWVDGEHVIMSQLTWHRHHTGIEFGPCELTLANNLITGIDQGAGAVISGSKTDLKDVLASYVAGSASPFRQEPTPLPYVVPGPATGVPTSVVDGGLAREAAVDLRLLPNHPLHRKAERIPGDDTGDAQFIGAYPPDTDNRCDLRDPLPPSSPAVPEPVTASPVVDYRARDARSLMAVMMDRALTVMPDWTETNPADMTMMLMELMAERLDHLTYRQENAVAEGFLSTALLRRSVEDHARWVDYLPDPGLSATAMLRFWIDKKGLSTLNLRGKYDKGERLEIPPDTLVVNPNAEETSVIFATEASLALDYNLDRLKLHDELDARSTSAILEDDLTSLEVGRWLIIKAEDPDTPVHVVRVTRVERGTDTTRIFWDPRRPAPTRYEAATTEIFGNVIPAHHGVPLTSGTFRSSGITPVPLDLLNPWCEQMRLSVNNSQDRDDVYEVELPLYPVSVQAPGWPLAADSKRNGTPRIEIRVDGEIWDRTENLALKSPTDESYVLRSGHGGGGAIRFGNGVNGAALPKGTIALDVSMRIGLGSQGNVGSGGLTRILAFGDSRALDEILSPDASDRDEKIYQHVRVTNPIPAIGGRDPETLGRIRYRAPLEVRDTLSAVVARDYERLLKTLPEVSAARAVVVDVGIRRMVRTTLLLKDEDTLTGPDNDPHRDAERLRRWALARGFLESTRLLGFDVEMLPPKFVPLDIDLIVDAEPWIRSDALAARIKQVLSGNGGLFDPDRTGLGGDVHLDTIHRWVLGVDGVAAVRIRRLRRLEPDAIEHVDQGVLPIGSEEVAVIRNPYGRNSEDGLVTVTVCGGLS